MTIRVDEVVPLTDSRFGIRLSSPETGSVFFVELVVPEGEELEKRAAQWAEAFAARIAGPGGPAEAVTLVMTTLGEAG